MKSGDLISLIEVKNGGITSVPNSTFIKASFSALISLSFSLSAYCGTYAGGTGTSGSPYLIATLADLEELSATPADWAAGKYFAVTADIDASATSTSNGGSGFSPIGTNVIQFLGSFDGNGHVISGLTINRTAQSYIGLFGYAGGGSSIQNVALEGTSVTGNSYVGGLSGYSNGGTVSASYAAGTVTGSGNFVGGLIGEVSSVTVSECYAAHREGSSLEV
jgi:hypothetical protein